VATDWNEIEGTAGGEEKSWHDLELTGQTSQFKKILKEGLRGTNREALIYKLSGEKKERSTPG